MDKVGYITAYTKEKDGLSLESYQKLGGFEGLKKAFRKKPEEIIQIIRESGLKGRGGAGFDTGIKWGSVKKGDQVYFVCNADEGEPGTFKDRFILERSPYLVLEGMTLGGYALGACKGFLYLRGEYPEILLKLRECLKKMKEQNLLGKDILGSGFYFDIEIKKGGGSYVVGDETALLNSLMGNRGYPMLKPPYPTEEGLWGKPTVINNVETLSLVPIIINRGIEEFRSLGTEKCPGPKLFCVSGHVNKPGVYELPMGTTIREVIKTAGGVRGYLKAVQVGGTAGPVYDQRALDYPLDYISMRERGGALGSGALVVMNSLVSMVEVLEVTARFFSEESCGQCFPCRYGTRQMEFMAKKIATGNGKLAYLDLIKEIVNVMYATSYCPFGQSVQLPINTLFEFFKDEIVSQIKQQSYLREVV